MTMQPSEGGARGPLPARQAHRHDVQPHQQDGRLNDEGCFVHRFWWEDPADEPLAAQQGVARFLPAQRA